MSKRKKIFQTGIFAILVFVPVLVFLSIFLLGDNHYYIPKYFPVDVVDNDTVYHKVPPFSFVNQNGEVITEEYYKNKIYVVDYFFTTCLGPCPQMSEGMQYLQKMLKQVDDVKLLSHTVDPSHDTVNVLKEYAELYDADPNYWNLVTGSKTELYKQAREGYFLVATVGDGSDTDFIHSQKFVLVDREGVIRGYYDGTDGQELKRLITEINIIRYEEKLTK